MGLFAGWSTHNQLICELVTVSISIMAPEIDSVLFVNEIKSHAVRKWFKEVNHHYCFHALRRRKSDFQQLYYRTN